MEQMDLKMLIVDDDRNILRTLKASLESLGADVVECESGEAALPLVEGRGFDLVLTDIRLGGLSGVDLIRSGRRGAPATHFVAMTAFASYESAVAAIKEGAFDYLPKPFSVGQLEHVLRKVKKVIDLQRENDNLRRARIHPEYFGGYTSPGMRRLEELVRKVAPTDATVLIAGESGTGKSEFARLLHARSPRAARPFIEVNCASLAETLLESELFGHVKGAFTGATHDKVGKLELAGGGTVFLDEVGELSPAGQAKLLRFLQEKVVERVGSSKPVQVDARVIAATNKKLEDSVANGEFREDLFYRLNVFECTIVPLRQRREDLPVLIQQIVKEQSTKAGYGEPLQLEGALRERLIKYSWPGNVRELRNVVERLVILAQGSTATLDDLPEAVKIHAISAAPKDEPYISLRDLEREHIVKVLAHEKNQERAARVLGITTVTLWRKRKEYGLE